MYSIRWTETHSNMLVIGNQNSITHVANMLENRKVFFKVSCVISGPISQSTLGYGGFKHWLDRDQSFPG